MHLLQLQTDNLRHQVFIAQTSADIMVFKPFLNANTTKQGRALIVLDAREVL